MKLQHAMMVGCIALSCACGGDDSQAIAVSLDFPGQGSQQSSANSVHIWVVTPGSEDATCDNLVAEVTDPYSSKFRLQVDTVFLIDERPVPTIDVAGVSTSASLTYVEVVDFVGKTRLAGCVDTASSVTVALRRPGTFDCTIAETPDGALCDDGLFCNLGETCQGGQCSGGAAQTCASVVDDCNGATCSEELGCQPVAVPDGRGCEDGAYCTESDTCQSGMCTAGPPRDCSGSDAGTCRVGTCNEELAACEGLDNDACSTLDPQHDCYFLACEVNGWCLGVGDNNGGACSDQCMTGGTCSGTSCSGGTPQIPPESPAELTCDDGIDNDCDGFIDCDDTADCSC